MSANYEKGKLSEKAYLDTVHATMRSFLSANILFTNKELLALLQPYREVIWNSKNDDQKRNYYGILSNQAQMAGQLGEMRYYAEKINEVEQKKNKQPSVTALTVIADYYNTLWSFKNTQSLYHKNRDFILSLPQKALRENLGIDQLAQSSIMLNKFGEALFKSNDTSGGNEAISVLEKIASIAKRKYSTSHYELANIEYSRILMNVYRGKGSKSGKIIREAILKLEEFRNNEYNPSDLKGAATFTIIDNKVTLFLDEKNVDSASHYINILKTMISGNSYDRYMLQKYESRILYEQGFYKKSIDTLIGAMLISEDIRKDIVKDVNEMMYAQAKAEERQMLLADAEGKRKMTEKRLYLASAIVLILIIGGLLAVRYTRRRQKAKFLAFKLNMARNLHDETNPALLYAKALIKSSRQDDQGKVNIELGSHIDHTMELIRSLSHDLKSDKQYVLSDVIAKIEKTLDKLNTGNEFSFDIHAKVDRKRFISHYQFSQLNAILNECITNTIKHASFNKINIAFASAGNRLSITYKDNGKGWQTQQPATGIGIKNMEDRVNQINGEWKIDNAYPNGYQINIALVLR